LGCLEATGWAEESLVFLDTAVQLLHVRCAVCPCTVLLEHKVVTNLRIAGSSIMSLWRRDSSSSIEEVSKRYHQNFLLCNNNEITAYIAELFNGFAFFKAVQQQIVGKVVNSITHLWADNFCLQQWKNY